MWLWPSANSPPCSSAKGFSQGELGLHHFSVLSIKQAFLKPLQLSSQQLRGLPALLQMAPPSRIWGLHRHEQVRY